MTSPASAPLEPISGIRNLAHPDGSASRPPGLDHRLDPETTAVVVVDVQRMFTDLLQVPVSPPLDQVRQNMTLFLEEARRAGLTIILVRTVIAEDQHSRNTLGWPDFMRANLAPGTPGTEFDSCVSIAPGDLQLIKQRYSAFHGTTLDVVLRERGIETVVLFGITTNVCVQSSARDAWQHDYEVITVADCCTEMGKGEHEASLAYTARNFGLVATSTEVIAMVRTPVATG